MDKKHAEYTVQAWLLTAVFRPGIGPLRYNMQLIHAPYSVLPMQENA